MQTSKGGNATSLCLINASCKASAGSWNTQSMFARSCSEGCSPWRDEPAPALLPCMNIYIYRYRYVLYIHYLHALVCVWTNKHKHGIVVIYFLVAASGNRTGVRLWSWVNNNAGRKEKQKLQAYKNCTLIVFGPGLALCSLEIWYTHARSSTWLLGTFCPNEQLAVVLLCAEGFLSATRLAWFSFWNRSWLTLTTNCTTVTTSRTMQTTR